MNALITLSSLTAIAAAAAGFLAVGAALLVISFAVLSVLPYTAAHATADTVATH